VKTIPSFLAARGVRRALGLLAVGLLAAADVPGQATSEKDLNETEIRSRIEQLNMLTTNTQEASERQEAARARALTVMRHAEWVSLFDGKSLKGWKQLDGQAKFEVRDGAIVGTVTPGVKQDSFLVTRDAKFSDFVFECEFKPDAGLNSGVQFRSLPADDTIKRVYGYQYEIDPTPRALTAAILEEGRREWLAPAADQGEPQEEWVKAHGDLLKPGEWNTLRIEARGKHLRTWLNDQLMADLEDRDIGRIPRGFIGLQVPHADDPRLIGKQIAFRNLRVWKFE
jgi:Domain of Unknown Function (DUF1080)